MVQGLRSRFDCHFVILNGENAAGGLGITKPTAAALFSAGADAITLGNHTFAKRDVASYLSEEPRILRPANYPPSVLGFGWSLFEAATGDKLAVVSLMGRTFMDPIDCPFRAADAALAEIGDSAKIVIVDMHAEATSEKKAMGYHLDGRVSAVLGTHTHVQTSDERVLPGGTAYITDVGMTGVIDSVLGMSRDVVLSRFITGVPGKFELAEGPTALNGVVIEIEAETGRAVSIQRVVEAE
jgi:metallophosphoesterase (TIGR00282 family)